MTPERPPVSPSTRRQFLHQSVAAVGVLSSPAVFAARDTIRIGYISPRTGPLGALGETDTFILAQVRKTLAAGLTIGGVKYAVEILDRDTQSDPARASQLAKALINSDKIDLMLTTTTPETVNPVSDACEAAGVPCLSTVMPWEAWYFGRGAKPGAPSPFKWTYHFSFGGGSFTTSYTSQFAALPTNKKIGVLDPNEEAMLRKIADLLFIRHSDYIQTKLAVCGA